MIYLFQKTATTGSINAAGRNTVITSLMVCCGFVMCVSPVQIVIFVGNFRRNMDYGSWLYQFTVVLVEFNSCINCFIYAAKYREFQKAVRRLVSRNHGTDIEANATASASGRREGHTAASNVTELRIAN